ncbi:MAG: hypothetical protein QM764_08210 [Chitinophagaceae bacterium]
MLDEYLNYYLLRGNDLYLAPICLLILYFFVFLIRRKYRKTEIQRYILPAITLRFVFVILYVLVLQFYYGFGDSYNYYQGVLDMHKAVSDDISYLSDIYTKLALENTDRLYSYFRYDANGFTYYYMMEPRTYFVAKLGLPFSLIFNKSFLCISFCISFLSFLGSWMFFKMFYEMYPHLHRKIAIASLFLPSLLFWGVSLLKDPFCIAAMGYFIYAAYSLFIKKKRVFMSIIQILIAGFFLINLKPYILFSLVAVFSLWIFYRFRENIADRTLRNVSTIIFTILAVLAGFFATQGLGQAGNSQFAADQLLTTVNRQQAIFSNNHGEAEGALSNFTVGSGPTSSIGSLIALFPVGIVNTYFRPFLWDVRSPMMILSAFESFCFLSITLMCFWKIGFLKTFQSIFSDPVIAFCFVFAAVFGGIIGVTTTNFGALVRYKIPCISFYAMAFILVMDKSKKFSSKYIFSKKLF